MRILRSFGLATLFAGALALIPSAAHAQIAVGIGIGPVVGYPAPVYVGGPPICSWGYYSYYPYDCAPYGYYGSNWFYDGLFIGAGPWYSGWYGRPWGWGYGNIGYYGWRNRGYYGGGYYGRGYRGGYGYRGAYGNRGAYSRGGYGNAYRGRGNAYRGGSSAYGRAGFGAYNRGSYGGARSFGAARSYGGARSGGFSGHSSGGFHGGGGGFHGGGGGHGGGHR